jgi:hypothetical protein
VEIFRRLYPDAPLRLGHRNAVSEAHDRWSAGLSSSERLRFPDPDLFQVAGEGRFRFRSITHAVSATLRRSFSIRLTADQVSGAYERWIACGKPGAELVEDWGLHRGIRLPIKKGKARL